MVAMRVNVPLAASPGDPIWYRHTKFSGRRINMVSIICTTPLGDQVRNNYFCAVYSPLPKILRRGSGRPGGVRFDAERFCTRIPICLMMLRPRKMLQGFATADKPVSVENICFSQSRV